MNRIVVLSPYAPFPLVSGDRKRLAGILRALSPHYAVTLIAPGEPEDFQIEAILGAAGKWRPVAIEGNADELVVGALRSELSDTDVHAILVTGYSTADVLCTQYAAADLAAPVIVDQCLVPFVMASRAARTCGMRVRARHNFRTIERQDRKILRRLLPRVSFVVCSEEDRQHLLTLGNGNIFVAENFADIRLAQKRVSHEERRPELLLMGPFDSIVNVDAITWFARRVMPHLAGRLGAHRVIAAGKGLSGRYREIAVQSGIELLGWVDDLVETMAHCSGFLVPLRIGSGTKTRILDAGLLELPVITTTVGAEGIPMRHGEHAVIADRDKDLADGIAQLVRDPAWGASLAGGLRHLVEERYQEEQAMQRYPALIEQALAAQLATR